MKLGKYSFGIGDRFGRQGEAQLAAFVKAQKEGIHLTPVWNKSYREHQNIHSTPADVRTEVDQAVQSLQWKDTYFVDADHVSLANVDYFLDSSDFFTLDVAGFIGKTAEPQKIQAFVKRNKKFLGDLNLPGIEEPFLISQQVIREIAEKYLFAAEEAGRIYRRIAGAKKDVDFVVEVSMDETGRPQAPLELFFILAALSHEQVPLQTIAPKFTGRFNKGVDYTGDVQQFSKEFEQDIAVIQFAIKAFKLSPDLKLSVHSGSDKFSLYEPIRQAMQKYSAGVHIKTAGTTWLEEVIGLAEAGGDGLGIAKEIYNQALQRFDELCRPYATVINIDRTQLPSPEQVKNWDGKTFTDHLRHNQSNPRYNKHFRQLLHVGYKIAAEMGEKYTDALKRHKEVIAKNVTENLYERHIKRIF